MYGRRYFAINPAKKFYADIPNLRLKIYKNELLIESPAEKIKGTWKGNTENADEINSVKAEADSLLKFHQALLNEINNPTEEQLSVRLRISA